MSDESESEAKTCPVCEREFEYTSEYGRFCSTRCYLNRPMVNGKWSEQYDRCVECQSTARPHASKGRCVVCDGRIRQRIKKGVAGASCQICGESRVVEAAHILPRKVIGQIWEQWMLLNLCPTHHKLYDTHSLNREEWQKIEQQVRVAFDRYKVSGLLTPARMGVD
jgi:hypothetical protein